RCDSTQPRQIKHCKQSRTDKHVGHLLEVTQSIGDNIENALIVPAYITERLSTVLIPFQRHGLSCTGVCHPYNDGMFDTITSITPAQIYAFLITSGLQIIVILIIALL